MYRKSLVNLIKSNYKLSYSVIKISVCLTNDNSSYYFSTNTGRRIYRAIFFVLKLAPGR